MKSRRNIKKLWRAAWRIERILWNMKVGKREPLPSDKAQMLRDSILVPVWIREVAEVQLNERNSYQVRDGFVNRARAEEFRIRKILRSGRKSNLPNSKE